MRPWSIIGVGSGWGARDMGTADGPKVLLEHTPPYFQPFPTTITNWHPSDLLVSANPTPLPAHQAKIHRDHVLEMVIDLSHQTKQACLTGHIPLVFGGDHSTAIGTWSGIKEARVQEDIGLIWIDAHMDAHTPETSPSLNIHGMPVAALLGYGDPAFTSLGHCLPKIKPENLCLMGVRSFEKAEAAFLNRLGVLVYEMKDIQNNGFYPLFQKARHHIRADRFGISLDIDAFDPAEAPGTGTPEKSGLRLKDVASALQDLGQDPSFLALEITELNPHRDINNKTCQLIWELVTIVTGGTSNDW